MILRDDNHKKLIDKLDKVIDLEHVKKIEQLHESLWNCEDLPYLPCISLLPLSSVPDWPCYKFTERWNDIEKSLIYSLGWVYSSAIIKDDRIYQVRPPYGVVNIPELFGVKTIISDEGNSLSEGLKETSSVKKLINAGIPDFDANPHNQKIIEYVHLAKNVFSEYEKLSKTVHFTLPDTQGPFDLASLIWGTEIFMGMYDEPELFNDFMELVTNTFIEYNKYLKKIIGEPLDSAYHTAGVRLVRGGVRVCDDSSTLISREFYKENIAPFNAKAFAPFNGGWLHYCGNGNHILPVILDDIPGVNAIHLGNPDMHDFSNIMRETAKRNIVLIWSGAIDDLPKALSDAPGAKLLLLLENKYAPNNIEDAKFRLEQTRAGNAVASAKW